MGRTKVLPSSALCSGGLQLKSGEIRQHLALRTMLALEF